ARSLTHSGGSTSSPARTASRTSLSHALPFRKSIALKSQPVRGFVRARYVTPELQALTVGGGVPVTGCSRRRAGGGAAFPGSGRGWGRGYSRAPPGRWPGSGRRRARAHQKRALRSVVDSYREGGLSLNE